MRVPRVIRVAPRSNLTAETPVIALRRIAPVALLLTVGTLAIACEKAERSAAMPTEQSAVMAVTEAPAPPPPAMVGDASGVLRGTDVGRGAIGSAFGTGSGNGGDTGGNGGVSGTTPTPTPVAHAGSLPVTGNNVAYVLGGGVLLVLAGRFLMVMARKRSLI